MRSTWRAILNVPMIIWMFIMAPTMHRPVWDVFVEAKNHHLLFPAPTRCFYNFSLIIQCRNEALRHLLQQVANSKLSVEQDLQG